MDQGFFTVKCQKIWKYPSIHPSIQVLQMFLSPASRGVPRPDETYNPSKVLGLPQDLGGQLNMPRKPGILITCSNLNWPVSTRRISSELPLDGSPHAKGEPREPTEETYVGCLYLQVQSFGHEPKLMTVGDGQTIDRLVNQAFWSSFLFSTTVFPVSTSVVSKQ